MRKRVASGPAIKAIRVLRSATDPTFRGSQFATKCLMSHAHLCNIEAGRKQPPEDVIHRIAAHLGVPVDAISHMVDVPMEAVA